MERTFAHEVALVGVKALAALLVAFVLMLFFVYAVSVYEGHDTFGEDAATACNAAVVPLMGEISVFGSPDEGEEYADDFAVRADDVVADIRAADEDPAIAGIVLRIDSPGGGMVASEIVAQAVRGAKKPVVALIREMGVSGGYMAAAAADRIVASPNSDVGSIGVTNSYVENIEENAKMGRRYVELVAGKYKNAMDPNRPLSAEERALAQRDLDLAHANFIAMVASWRAMPVDVVRTLADGSSMPGTLALERGLVDTLGNQEMARVALEELLGGASVTLCE